jgi:hypothetical protein
MEQMPSRRCEYAGVFRREAARRFRAKVVERNARQVDRAVQSGTKPLLSPGSDGAVSSQKVHDARMR